MDRHTCLNCLYSFYTVEKCRRCHKIICIQCQSKSWQNSSKKFQFYHNYSYYCNIHCYIKNSYKCEQIQGENMNLIFGNQ